MSSSTITPITINAMEASDLIYAIAIAQTAASSFTGFTGQLSPGSGFTQQQNSGYLLIEDHRPQRRGLCRSGPALLNQRSKMVLVGSRNQAFLRVVYGI